MSYLYALVPEYELDRQANVASNEARSTERKQAILAGLRKARGAKAPAEAEPNRKGQANAPAEAGGTGEAA